MGIKMKKRTLNQTWILCLRMWRWIAKPENKGKNIHTLKARWLHDNGFVNVIRADCFFCDYNKVDSECGSCPGGLVDPDFNCCNDDYKYTGEPGAFYKELLRLNRIRKGQK